MDGMKNFKCPNCGGNIEFDSKTQGMKCPYCDSEFDLEALAALDKEIENEKESDLSWNTSDEATWAAGETEGMEVLVCNSCGGEIITGENTGMTNCPYCGNPVVMRGKFQGDLKPDFVLPFKLDKKAAKEAFAKHLTGKKLLPKAFVEGNHIDEIKGIYVPFWLFDADVDADVRYKATKNRQWEDNNFVYRETKYYSVQRAGEMSFEKLPVDGSSQMPDDLMESLEPYDYSALKPFSTPYLSGYIADRYDVPREECIDRVDERIKYTVEMEFQNSISGFDSVDAEHSSIRYTNSSCKYALMPVWLMQTTWNGENYIFAMNGQTGKFVGNLPMDKAIYRRYFALYFIVTFIILMVVGSLVM